MCTVLAPITRVLTSNPCTEWPCRHPIRRRSVPRDIPVLPKLSVQGPRCSLCHAHLSLQCQHFRQGLVVSFGRVCSDLKDLRLQTCVSLLGRDWAPSKSALDALRSLLELMAHPNADDPIDTARAEEYHVDKAEYNRKAAEHTKKHASKYAQTCTLHSHVR